MKNIQFQQQQMEVYGTHKQVNPQTKPSHPSSHEKKSLERTMQYIKDRTKSFDDYFPCKVKNCKLKHVMNWLNLFIDYHNSELKTLK